MKEVRNGNYGMYKGKLYRIGQIYKDSVHLCSINRDDLNNGFICNYTKTQIEYYGFICIKDVPKSEITEAYEIKTHALYKGMEFGIISLDDEFIRIENECSNDPNDETNKQLRSWGFSEYIRDKFSIIFDKYIPANDPEIKIIEERTEIDISKL